MEFKEVVGRRRSIRFFEPDKPVEREKIQVILETARLASCAVNAHWLRAIVVDRDKIPPDKLNQLKTPVAALTLDLAPVHIYFFCDLGVVKRIKGSRLRELVDAGALAPTHGWSHKFVDDFVYPQILEPMTNNLQGYLAAAMADCGGAVQNALLAAFDEGLGACLSSGGWPWQKRLLSTRLLRPGYEGWRASGERSRTTWGDAWRRSSASVSLLSAIRMPSSPSAPARWMAVSASASRAAVTTLRRSRSFSQV